PLSTTPMTAWRLASSGSFSETGLWLASTPLIWCGDWGRCIALHSSNLRQTVRRFNGEIKEGEALFPLQASGVGSNFEQRAARLQSRLKAAACAHRDPAHVAFQIEF